MKKLVYLIVVFLLFLQSGGILYFYKIEQLVQRHKMQRIIEQENPVLEEFTLPATTFHRSLTAEKEILIDYKLYDIKSWSIKGNSILLVAVRDKAEEIILSSARNAMKACETAGNHFLLKLTTFISLDFVSPPVFEFSFDLFPLLNIISQFDRIIQAGIFDILTPPPQQS